MKLSLDIPNRLLGFIAGGGICFAAGLVVASGFPEPAGAMVYSGILTDTAGSPRLTTENIEVELFDAANNGTRLCGTASTSYNLAASLGRFRAELPAACADAARDHGDVWAQVTVGGLELQPRQKLGATPYAMVARDAQTADLALSVADGVVGTDQLSSTFLTEFNAHGSRLASLDASVAALADLPFASWRVQAVFSTTANQIAFLTELADSANELDMNNSLYVASRTGLHLVTGTFTTGNVGDQCSYLVAFYKNNSIVGSQVIGRQSLTTGTDNLGASISMVVPLNATDALSMWGQTSCSGTTIFGEFQVTFLR